MLEPTFKERRYGKYFLILAICQRISPNLDKFFYDPDLPLLSHKNNPNQWGYFYGREVDDVRTYWMTSTNRFFIPKLSFNSVIFK